MLPETTILLPVPLLLVESYYALKRKTHEKAPAIKAENMGTVKESFFEKIIDTLRLYIE